MTNQPNLNFVDNYSILVLSEIPVFSEALEFPSDNLFSYSISVRLDDKNSVAGGSYSNDFSFLAYELQAGIKEYFDIIGYFPVTGQVQIMVNRDGLEWHIGVARTQEVIISF